MSEITKPIILDETGQAIKTQLAANNPSSQLNAIAQNLALIATSSNAAQTLAQLAKTIADEANSIAKGATVAQVFDTEALMTAWIKNSANKGKLKVGDNLYIKAVDVPDYWVSAVLQNPNASGAYYEVSKLETGKVDLNDVVSASSDTDTTIDYAYGQHGNVSKRISAANLASVVAGEIMNDEVFFSGFGVVEIYQGFSWQNSPMMYIHNAANGECAVVAFSTSSKVCAIVKYGNESSMPKFYKNGSILYVVAASNTKSFISIVQQNARDHCKQVDSIPSGAIEFTY